MNKEKNLIKFWLPLPWPIKALLNYLGQSFSAPTKPGLPLLRDSTGQLGFRKVALQTLWACFGKEQGGHSADDTWLVTLKFSSLRTPLPQQIISKFQGFSKIGSSLGVAGSLPDSPRIPAIDIHPTLAWWGLPLHYRQIGLRNH